VKPAIEEIGPKKCTGCFGCYVSCPEKAIEMEFDEDGFFMPIVDHGSCKKCGVCQSKCPVIAERSVGNAVISVNAARTQDANLLKSSSSGGIFGELALSMLSDDGVVVGAGWGNDDLVHLMISSKGDLPSIQGSKYIQSRIGMTYQKVLSQSKEGRKVLFCGTPCQVASLNLFLRGDKKARKNVWTCDVVCHGVASTKAFNVYLDSLARKRGAKDVSRVDFRNKKNGWQDYSIKVDFSNGAKYQKSHSSDPFFVAYIDNLLLRPSCYTCPVSELPRHGDITLGDLWGARKDLYNYWGVSLVILNNERGLSLFKEAIGSDKVISNEISIDYAMKGNPRVSGSNFEIPEQRSTFFKALKTSNPEDEIIEYFQTTPRPKRFLSNVARIYKRIFWRNF